MSKTSMSVMEMGRSLGLCKTESYSMIEKNCQKLNEKNGVPKGKKSYNLSEIMAILGICRSSATKLIRTNQFSSVRIGREVRVLKSDFDAWLDSNTK